jgi:hypothetical protein
MTSGKPRRLRLNTERRTPTGGTRQSLHPLGQAWHRTSIAPAWAGVSVDGLCAFSEVKVTSQANCSTERSRTRRISVVTPTHSAPVPAHEWHIFSPRRSLIMFALHSRQWPRRSRHVAIYDEDARHQRSRPWGLASCLRETNDLSWGYFLGNPRLIFRNHFQGRGCLLRNLFSEPRAVQCKSFCIRMIRFVFSVPIVTLVC